MVCGEVGIRDWLSSFIVGKGLEWERRDQWREDMVIVVNKRARDGRHGCSGKQEICRKKTCFPSSFLTLLCTLCHAFYVCFALLLFM